MIKLKIHYSSQGVRFKPLYENIKPHLKTIFAELTNVESYYVKGRGMVRTEKECYGVYLKETDEYVLHRNHALPFINVLYSKGFLDKSEVEETVEPEYEVEEVDIIVNEEAQLRDEQDKVVAHMAEDKAVRVVPLQTGQGKDQPLDAKIKVPGGWSTMGEMHVGKVITAPDGSATNVIGVFPQGVKSVYRVTFRDGRSTLAGAEHLWEVYYVNTSPRRRWRIVTTLEMLRLISLPNPRVYVRLINPTELDPEENLRLPPYTLGVILGKGGTTGGRLSITKTDKEIFSEIKSELIEGHRFFNLDKLTKFIVANNGRGKNDYLNGLRELGLLGKRSWEKFIPEEYLNGSKRQRLDLLQGLMDTDGEVGTSKSTSFTSTSLNLAEGVSYLVRSLGGHAKIASRITKYTYKGQVEEGRLSYKVSIRMPNPREIFRLPRKLERLVEPSQYGGSRLKLQVKSVEYEKDVETQCISVDHPDHLYITDDFIVTHNTFCSLYYLAEYGKRTVITMAPRDIPTWKKDASWIYRRKDRRIDVIQGSKKLLRLMDKVEKDKYIDPIIVISIDTLRSYINNWIENGSKSKWPIAPPDLYRRLKIGLRINDESHENLHFNYVHAMLTHCPKVIYLSATLQSHSAWTNDLYQTIYPQNDRLTGIEWIKYIDTIGIGYKLREPDKVRCTVMGGRYNHNVFEQWILKSPQRKRNYFTLIYKCLKVGFLNVYEPGMKAALFFSSKQMCSEVALFLKNALEIDLSISDYTGDHEDDVLYEQDVVCTTIGSAGTGKDIKGLTFTLLTVSLSSMESNIQVLGRLRKFPEDQYKSIQRPTFMWLTCASIEKQLRYHRQKLELFPSVALSVKSTMTQEVI